MEEDGSSVGPETKGNTGLRRKRDEQFSAKSVSLCGYPGPLSGKSGRHKGTKKRSDEVKLPLPEGFPQTSPDPPELSRQKRPDGGAASVFERLFAAGICQAAFPAK